MSSESARIAASEGDLEFKLQVPTSFSVRERTDLIRRCAAIPQLQTGREPIKRRV